MQDPEPSNSSSPLPRGRLRKLIQSSHCPKAVRQILVFWAWCSGPQALQSLGPRMAKETRLRMTRVALSSTLIPAGPKVSLLNPRIGSWGNKRMSLLTFTLKTSRGTGSQLCQAVLCRHSPQVLRQAGHQQWHLGTRLRVWGPRVSDSAVQQSSTYPHAPPKVIACILGSARILPLCIRSLFLPLVSGNDGVEEKMGSTS